MPTARPSQRELTTANGLGSLGRKTGQVIRIDICERILPNTATKRGARIQPSPGEKVRRPPERGQRKRPREAPQGEEG